MFGVGLCAVSLFPVPAIFQITYTWIGMFILCKLCFSVSFLHTIYADTSFCILMLITELLCYKLLVLMGWGHIDIMSAGSERAVYILMSKVIQLLLVLIAGTLMHREQASLNIKGLIPLLPCQIFSIYFCDSILRRTGHGDKNITIGFIITLIGILYINIIIIVYAEVMKSRQEEQHNADLRQQQLELQLNYYERLQEDREQTRALWHDMSKCLTAMEAMVSSDNKSAAAQVFSDVKSTFQQVGNIVDVGNSEINAILNHYVQQTRKLEIPFSLTAWVPSMIPIPLLDLSIIIGNTFENAVEACLALPVADRDISLQISVHNNILLYEMSNSYTANKKCRLRTDHKYHGYGLQNIQSIVNKYDGTIDIQKQNNVFVLSIVLNLTGKNDSKDL